KDILDELDDVVTVTAYFSEDLPPQLLSNRRDFEDMLIEYEKRSGGNVVYEFINPNEETSIEQEAQQKGIAPVMINVTENDRVQQMRAYMGAAFQLGNDTEIIRLVQPGSGMEYELTTSIKKLALVDKPKVGIIQGHGEPSISEFPQLVQQLSVLYNVEPYTIDGKEIPLEYRALALVAPSDTIASLDLAMLDKFLESGGKLFVAHSNVTGDLQQGLLSKRPQIGVVAWLEDKGILIEDDFIIDTQCASVTVSQRQGFFTINSQKEFPYFPRVSNFEDHPLTQGLDEIVLTFSSPVLSISQDSVSRIIPIAFTTENSGRVTPPNYINIQKQWNQSEFGMGVQSIAVAAEGLGNGLGKMVVIGNGDFFINGAGQTARQVQADHVNFVSNSIDWLVDETGLIDLRTKGITSRPLDQIDDAERNLIKYGNVLAPILLLLVYGSVRRIRNQRKRQKWMQGIF
ncbi:MAG: GldG family protein, partial [Bacteroidota bacterium]